MTTLYNPALFEEPRDQPMKVVPLALRESLFSWIENSGRFHTSEFNEFQEQKLSEGLDDILELENYTLVEEEEEEESD
jgi:hypothetical protein